MPKSEIQKAIDKLLKQHLDETTSSPRSEPVGLPSQAPSPSHFEELPPHYERDDHGGVHWEAKNRHALHARAHREAHEPYRPLPSQIAKISPLQKVARLKASELAAADHDAYDTAQREIQGSFGKSSHKMVKPMLDMAASSSTGPENQQTLNYFDDLAKKMALQMRMEGKDFYEREIAPQTNYAYIRHGLWTSPKRNKAQQEAWKGIEKGIQDQEGKMLWEAKHRGLEEVARHKQRNLDAAHLAGNILEREKENSALGATAASNIEARKGFHNLTDLEMANQVGRQEQAEEERKLGETYEQARGEQLHPWRQMAHQQAIQSGLPFPAVFTGAKEAQPTPPNASAIGAATLASLAPHMLGTQERRAAGGLVGYADGGHVLPEVQMTPEMAYQMQLAQEMQHQQSNPHAAGFADLGAHMFANLGQDPLKSFGEGLQHYNKTVRDQQQAHQLQKERAANIMQQIQRSRLDQQQVIMDFDHKKKSLEEQARLHNAQIGHYGAQNELLKAQTDLYKKPQDTGSGLVPKGYTQSEEHKQQVKLNSELEKKSLEEREGIIEADNMVHSMENALKKGIGATGPLANMLTFDTFRKNETLANRRLFQSESIGKLMDALNKMKGTQSDTDMAVITKSMPTFDDPPEAIEAFVNKYRMVVDRAKQADRFIENEVKHGKSRLEAKKEWQQLALENPLFAVSSKSPESSNEPSLENLLAEKQKRMSRQ